jgi:predicted dehydrogenase
MQDEPIELGFIGGSLSSAVGYTHFNASRLDGRFKVAAGCFSRDSELNSKTGRAFGLDNQRVYTNWQALLEAERGRLGALVVLTPTPSHLDVVLSALDLGYAVICEKALGTSSDECTRISSAVNQKGGYLAVTYNYSGYPMVRELRRMIGDGRFGLIQQIQVEMPQESFARLNAKPQAWRCRDYSVPTVSLDLGVHVHHLVHFLSGGLKPLSVVADQASYGALASVVDNVYCIARYEQDMRVQAWWGKTALGHRNGLRIRVYGEHASAEWFQMDPEVLRWADNVGHHYLLDRGSSEAIVAQEVRYNRFKAGHPSGFIEAFANLYVDFAEELAALRLGQRISSAYVFGANHASDGLRLMEAINKSSRLNTWVALT